MSRQEEELLSEQDQLLITIDVLEKDFDNEFEVIFKRVSEEEKSTDFDEKLIEEFSNLIQILETMRDINHLSNIYEEVKLNHFIE